MKENIFHQEEQRLENKVTTLFKVRKAPSAQNSVPTSLKSDGRKKTFSDR